MEVWHRIAFNGDLKPTFKSVLDERGISYGMSPLPGNTVGLIYFDIVESDPNWPRIRELIQTLGASDIYNTIFARQEILAADWIRMVPSFEQGYPQPEKAWDRITYRNECSRCGAGFVQKSPFRLAKEPRLGRKDFLCLYWTSTYFCTPKILDALAEHRVRGYDVWAAIIHRTNRPSVAVSQLLFPSVTGPCLLNADELHLHVCPECGLAKQASHLRGYMHVRKTALHSDVDVQVTQEWFGSGHMAFREVLISNRVAKLALEAGWSGIALKPVVVD
jgi:hypothetical protein